MGSCGRSQIVQVLQHMICFRIHQNAMYTQSTAWTPQWPSILPVDFTFALEVSHFVHSTCTCSVKRYSLIAHTLFYLAEEPGLIPTGRGSTWYDTIHVQSVHVFQTK